jgi:uncharacterized LabA/DUF88 family protein
MSVRSYKIALFIDGPNLFATAKTLGFDIDYKRLLKEFQSQGTLVRAFYYTAISEDQEYVAIRPCNSEGPWNWDDLGRGSCGASSMAVSATA